MSGPAFTRLPVDERRRRLLALGVDLFTRHAYDELSMARIAREAGISKALLYHYFPSKQAFFVATLADGAQELQERVQPDPELPPGPALLGVLDAYLSWIEERPEAFEKLVRSAAAIPDVREIVDAVRTETGRRLLDGLGAGDPSPPAVRAAVAGWLAFMDGAILDWIAHGDLGRDELAGLLVGTLLGALTAAGAGELVQRVAG